ncbi:MAG: ATP-binding protein [Colwellia sp.]
MISLNNYPIKYRVLLLVAIPLIGIISLSAFQIKDEYITYGKLLAASENLISGDLVLKHNIEAKSLAFNSLFSKDSNSVETAPSENIQGNKSVYDTLSNLENIEKSLVKNANNLYLTSLSKDEKNLALETKYEETISTLAELTQSFKDFEQDEIADWYSEVVDTENEMIKNLEKLHSRSGIKNIDQNLKVIMQLRWIMFWASQENWYSDIILNLKGNEELASEGFSAYANLINQYAVKQELFIERFLTMGANEEQIKLMLEIFNSDAFVLTAQFRELITEGDINLTAVQEEKFKEAFKDRFTLTLSASEKIANQIITDIEKESSNGVTLIFLILASLILAMFLISLLGFNVSYRIFSYLKETLKTLSVIEEKKDYSLALSTKGNDEFSTFSSTLNKLIDDRRIHDNYLVQAKKDADKANQAKSFFLANMSHEIRTPLNGILGMNTILKETKLSSSQKNHLSIIDQSSKTLLYLINDILDISKIESGNFEINPEPTDFRELIYSTTTLVMSKASEKHLELNVNFTSPTPYMVSIDAQRLRQVLMNLLSNAVKFTHKGAVIVTVHSLKDNDGKWTLSFEVQDSGIGISESNQKIIFDAFVQADGSITREFGGTGLGLAISAQIIKLMHGEIICTSEEGEGSKFSFDIQCDEVAGQATPPTPEPYQLVPIYLIHDEDNQQSEKNPYAGIKGELLFLGNKTYQQLNSIEDIPKEIDDKAIIFYFQKSLEVTKKEIEVLLSRYHKDQILLFQKTSDYPADYRDSVLGQISLPILGSSFLGVLKESYEQDLSSQEVPTSQNETAQNKEEVSLDKASGDASSALQNNTANKLNKHDGNIDEVVNILIVEDNLVNQKVTSLYLKTMGYQFEIADNGQIAVDMVLSGNQYNLILMDCMMPVMDGFNASINIREYEANNKLPRTPIIALTASIFKEDIDRCYASHMDGYLPKPVDKAVLHKKIKEYLEKGKT